MTKVTTMMPRGRHSHIEERKTSMINSLSGMGYSLAQSPLPWQEDDGFVCYHMCQAGHICHILYSYIEMIVK